MMHGGPESINATQDNKPEPALTFNDWQFLPIMTHRAGTHENDLMY